MATEEVLSNFDRNPGSGSYTDALRTEGLSIFDGRPRGGFEVKIRGYDRTQVEAHVRQLEQVLAYTRAMNRQLDRQIAQLRQRLGERGTLQLSERPVPDRPPEPTDGGPTE